jgi:hypothetical protein
MRSAVGEATLLRTLMKNDPHIKRRVVNALKEEVGALGLAFDDAVWDRLIIASTSELESSRAHVVVETSKNS